MLQRLSGNCGFQSAAELLRNTESHLSKHSKGNPTLDSKGNPTRNDSHEHIESRASVFKSAKSIYESKAKHKQQPSVNDFFSKPEENGHNSDIKEANDIKTETAREPSLSAEDQLAQIIFNLKRHKPKSEESRIQTKGMFRRQYLLYKITFE